MTDADRPYTPVLLDRIRALHRALDEHGFQHAFGGAIALGVHVEPRFTAGIDVNVIADPTEPAALLAALPDEIVVPDGTSTELAQRGQIRLIWPNPMTPVDLFLPQHPTYHQLVADRAVPAEMLDAGLTVISATDLIVFKVLFDRRKDWADIADLLEVGAGDTEDAATSIAAIVGPDDPRLGQLAELADEMANTEDRPRRPPLWDGVHDDAEPPT